MKIFGKGRNWLNFVIRPQLDLGTFEKNSSTLPDRAFFYHVGHICGEADRIFVKISSVMHLWRRKSL